MLYPFVFAQTAFFQHVCGIGARPVASDILLHEIILPALDAFNAHAVVFEIFEPHHVEIVTPPARRQVPRPIAFIADKLAQAAALGFGETVRAGTDGQRIGCGFQPLREAFVRKHGQFAQNHMQLGIALFEAEHHRARRGGFHRRHIRPIEFVHRRGGLVLRQRFKRIGHVFGQHGVAVVEFRLRIEPERNREAV